MTDASAWIADGTADTEPETVETPGVEEAVAEVIETEAVEAVATEAVETEAVVEEIVQQFIYAKLGDDAFELPDNLMVPQTRDGETTYVPIQDVLKGGMLESDYRHKTSELADSRRAFEAGQAKYAGQEAKIEARAKFVQEQEDQIKAALSDEGSAVQFQQHLNMLRDNPMYKETWEARWANRETEAERDALLAEQDKNIVDEASTTALGWIESLATEFAGVDQGRVADIYGQRLSAGQASLDISAVRSIYQAEADYLTRANAPLRDQLDTLSAKIDTLTASRAAEDHNETTAHAVGRAKTVPVSTGAGAPAKTTVPLTKFGPAELQERKSDWVKAG